MTISTLDELKAAVAGRMNRADITTQVAEGISACVGRLNRTLRHPEMLTVNTAFTYTARLTSLPTGFLQMEAAPIFISAGRRHHLRFIANPLGAAVDEGLTGVTIPTYYTIRGTKIELLPAASGTLELAYYAAIAQLSSGSSTDWLLTGYPDVYLYGGAYHTAIHLMDSERMAFYKPLFEEAVQELGISGKSSRYGPGMQIKVA